MGLSDVFLMVRLGHGFREEDHRGKVPFSSHHIKSTYYPHDFTVDVNLDHPAEVVFVRFLHSKVSFLPLPLFGRKSLYAAYT